MKKAETKEVLKLRINGVEPQIPILTCRLWEVEDEEGFIFEEGYIYETPYGEVITKLTNNGEEIVSCKLDWEALRLPA